MLPVIISLIIVAFVIMRKLPNNPSGIEAIEAIWTFVVIGGIVGFVVILVFNEIHSPLNIDKLLNKI
jgi:predicted acetyltransferase